MKKTAKKGFTLVELMVVIVIIGILAALAIPRFLGATNKSKAAEFKPVLKQIYTLQMAYQQEKDALGSTTTDIGFDSPGTTSRFSYTVSNVATGIGKAVVLTGSLKDLNNNTISTADGIACVNDQGVQRAHTTTFGGVAGVSQGTCP